MRNDPATHDEVRRPSARSLPVVSDEAKQSFCQSCALCCDGTLFNRVPLERSELAALRAIEFDIMEVLEQAYFYQPCAKLVESSCSVYARRPGNCRGYRCRILRRLEKGELEVEEAHSLVQKARELTSAIDSLLSSIEDKSGSIWTRLERFAKAENLQLESIEFSRRHPMLGMHATVLLALLETEFKVKKDAPAK